MKMMKQQGASFIAQTDQHIFFHIDRFLGGTHVLHKAVSENWTKREVLLKGDKEKKGKGPRW